MVDGGFGEDEVGIRGIGFESQLFQLGEELGPLFGDHVNAPLHEVLVLQGGNRRSFGDGVEGIGDLHGIEHVCHLEVGGAVAHPEVGHGVGLGEGLAYDQVVELVDLVHHGLPGIFGICLVEDDDSLVLGKDGFDVLLPEAVTGGVVGGRHDQDSLVGGTFTSHLVDIQLELLVQLDLPQGSRGEVHEIGVQAVGGHGDGAHLPGLGECGVDGVEDLVGSVAGDEVLHLQSVEIGEFGPQTVGVGVGISVQVEVQVFQVFRRGGVGAQDVGVGVHPEGVPHLGVVVHGEFLYALPHRAAVHLTPPSSRWAW